MSQTIPEKECQEIKVVTHIHKNYEKSNEMYEKNITLKMEKLYIQRTTPIPKQRLPLFKGLYKILPRRRKEKDF